MPEASTSAQPVSMHRPRAEVLHRRNRAALAVMQHRAPSDENWALLAELLRGDHDVDLGAA